jgi:hypothetical protein
MSRRNWWIKDPPWCWKFTIVSTFRGMDDDVVEVKEVMQDDPDIDLLIKASIKVLTTSHIGDQNFISCLNCDEAKNLRESLFELGEVFKK